MKSLLPPKLKVSLERAFKSRFVSYRRDGRVPVEVAESRWEQSRATPYQAAGLAYRQLWLFCMRNFPYMHAMNTRKDQGEAKPHYEIRKDLKPIFARLASNLGYDSAEIQELSTQDPFERIIQSLVESVRPRASFMWTTAMEEEMSRLCQFLHRIPEQQTMRLTPSAVCDLRDQPRSHRCGRPFDRSHNADRDSLYLNHIYDRHLCTGTYISSFGVKRDVFLAFFGRFDLDSAPENGEPTELPASCTPVSPAAPPFGSPEDTPRTDTASNKHHSGSRQGATRSSSCYSQPTMSETSEAESTRGSPIIYPVSTEQQEESVLAVDPILYPVRFRESIHQTNEVFPVFNHEWKVLYYDIHTRDIYAAGGDNVDKACETISRGYLEKEYATWVVDSGQLRPLEISDIEQTNEFHIRFVAQKGNFTITPLVKFEVTMLINRYYPEVQAEQLLRCWGYG